MRPATALALLLTATLAGCPGPVGGPADGAGTPTALPDDASATPDPQADATPDPSPDATPEDAHSGNTVAFEDLNDRQRAAFRDALDGEARFVPDSSYVADDEGYSYDLVDPFEDHRYVRYEGRYYRPEFALGRLYAAYEISATARSPPANATVVALSALPADVRDEVRRAVEEGRYTAPYGKWFSLPDSLEGTDYVRHGGETYALSYLVADFWAPVMTVEAAD